MKNHHLKVVTIGDLYSQRRSSQEFCKIFSRAIISWLTLDRTL